MITNGPLLEVKGLKAYFFLDEGVVKAVEAVDLTVPHGGVVGVVGESGCGKSVTAHSILGLIEAPGRIIEGQILFRRRADAGGDGPAGPGVVDLASLKPGGREMRSIRGAEIAMIFQEPMTSLSPVHTVGDQVGEVIRYHRGADRTEARRDAVEMLRRVGIPRPERRVDAYPFQLSGGMRQRAMIAMALACRPSLLIADEPTTALDVTTQAQIIELMQDLQREMGMAIVLITHNLGLVAEMCHQVVVMYLGEVVERSSVERMFTDPLHPYTRALLRSIPRLGRGGKRSRLEPITGMVPDPYHRPAGCPFHPRCPHAIPGTCDRVHPELRTLPDGRRVRCVLYDGA
jgi:peptide/nickel transport system ATP-binding protein